MSQGRADAFLAEWSRAYAARDVDALVALYSSDALFFGSTPELAVGPAGVRRYFEHLPPHQDPSVDFEVLATRTPVERVVQVASIGTFRWRGHAGTRIRFTHTLVELDGTWVATAHHASPA